MATIPQSLIILLAQKDGLLSQLYNLKMIFDNTESPPFYLESSEVVSVLTKIEKKIEEPITEDTLQIQKLKPIHANLDEILDELEPGIWTLKNIKPFLEESTKVLRHIANEISTLSLESNPNLTKGFMDLFVGYAQLILLLSNFQGRRLFLVLYRLVVYLKTRTDFEDFGPLLILFHKYDNPMKQLYEDLHDFAPAVSPALGSLIPLFTLVSTPDELRKKGVFSITLQENLLQYPIEDNIHFQLPYFSTYTQWIIYGLLFCPQLFESEQFHTLLYLVLANSYIIPIYRDVTFFPHQEFENLFGLNLLKTMKTSKRKQNISTALNNAITKSHQYHRELRAFLRQEINALANFMISRPTLLPLKIHIVLSAIGFCIYEVNWLFRHKRDTPKSKFKVSPDDLKPTDILPLMNIIEKLYNVVSTNTEIIQRYYYKFLIRNDLKALERYYIQFFQERKDKLKDIFEQNLKFIEELSEEKIKNNTSNLDILRLNWFRSECALSFKSFSITEPGLNKLGEFPSRLQKHIERSKMIDIMISQLNLVGGIHTFYPYIQDIYSIVYDTIPSPNLEQENCIIFLKLLNNSHMIISPFYTEELQIIGKKSKHYAKRLFHVISVRITGLVRSIASIKFGFTFLDQQITPVNAALHLINEQMSEQKGANKQELLFPGVESLFNQRKRVEQLQKWQNQFYRLAQVLSFYPTFEIYNKRFSPSKFLIEELENGVKGHLLKLIYEDDERSIIQKPSVFLSIVLNLIYSLKLVEDILNINTLEIVRKVMLKQIYQNNGGARGQIISLREPAILDSSIISEYMTWISSFIQNYITDGVIYSPLRKAFISLPGMLFLSEVYFNIQEMEALCNFFGPYGIRSIDNQILRFIVKDILELKDFVFQNSENIQKFAACYNELDKSWEFIKKITNIEKILDLLIHIGATLQLRELIYEALHKSLKNNASLIYENVELAFTQYPENLLAKEEFIDIDCYAQSCGLLSNSLVDHPFREAIMIANQTGTGIDWGLLPYLFGILFASPTWIFANYLPNIDSHLNNSHCIVKSIKKLLVIPFTVQRKHITKLEEEGEIYLKNQFRKFIEVSSFVILQVDRNKDPKKPVLIRDMFVILDKFIDNSNIFSRDLLDEFIPYTFLRTIYSRFFRETKADQKDEDFAKVSNEPKEEIIENSQPQISQTKSINENEKEIENN
ncbi:nck-associated protein [Anaeramoeba ignava]|uniref:Nck-associated protein n=1 Tax=Anaeramoeba ignava TaxID=1746090 RepID=A0A9Q0R9C0_ANAIG|nr:nck-associated protein [Anaeramoeba ignava]